MVELVLGHEPIKPLSALLPPNHIRVCHVEIVIRDDIIQVGHECL